MVLLHLADRAPQVGQQHDLGERRGRKGRRQAGALRRVVQDRLRHLLDDVAAGGRAHQAGNADPLAALHQNFGEREGHHQRALELARSVTSAEAKAIDGERSGQIQTVCEASHSRSRT